MFEISMELLPAHYFNFITALRSFHVYHNTVNWNPYARQEIAFKCEFNNPYDKFAVCGKGMLPGKIVPVVIGHAPKKIPRFFWFAKQKGVKLLTVVDNTQVKRSPLVQGGLEILIRMNITWNNEWNIKIVQEKLSRINFHFYEDASSQI